MSYPRGETLEQDYLNWRISYQSAEAASRAAFSAHAAAEARISELEAENERLRRGHDEIASLVESHRMRHTVEVGQRWRDTDPRSHNRIVRVVAIEDGKAVVGVVSGGWGAVGRRTKVSINRMKPGSRGYRLLDDCRALNTEETPE